MRVSVVPIVNGIDVPGHSHHNLMLLTNFLR